MGSEIKCESLDILCDVLHKFGNLMAADHELLLSSLLSQLSSNQASVRKKTVACIGKTNLNLHSWIFHGKIVYYLLVENWCCFLLFRRLSFFPPSPWLNPVVVNLFRAKPYSIFTICGFSIF